MQIGVQPPAQRTRTMEHSPAQRSLSRIEHCGEHWPGNGSGDSEKNELKPWLKQEWCIPPEADADFVCAMENVLDLYAQPLNPDEPVVTMDETTKQLTQEVIDPIPPTPDGTPLRYDTLYKRNGVAVLFMFSEPLRGWRRVNVCEGKTRKDWANQVKHLLDHDYPKAKKVHLVLDNLNTHNGASLYEAFPPEEARRLLSRLEFHYTPKHGSWLNVAEIELSVLSRQCLNRRIPDLETLQEEIEAWQKDRNHTDAKVHWQFTVENARVKLRKLYPTI